jgi:hypothetical protein
MHHSDFYDEKPLTKLTMRHTNTHSCALSLSWFLRTFHYRLLRPPRNRDATDASPSATPTTGSSATYDGTASLHTVYNSSLPLRCNSLVRSFSLPFLLRHISVKPRAIIASTFGHAAITRAFGCYRSGRVTLHRAFRLVLRRGFGAA